MSEDLNGRRRFLAICTNGLAGLLGLLLALPALGYVLSPLRRRFGTGAAEGGFQDLGAVDSFTPGQWQLATLEVERQDGWEKLSGKHGVWVRRKDSRKQEFEVLSPICPHLGCPLQWHSSQNQFVCPCHGGVFDANGSKVSGPPPRSMDPLEHRCEGGRLLVRWQDFKIGLPDRLPIAV
jgi:menaquinol-cytochrome c reductase iron-sulfur subunit